MMPAKSKQSVAKVVMLPIVNNYPALVKAVREELTELDFFIRRRTAESYWRVGKFIHEHLLQHKERADHGSRFFEKLATDVERDSSTLQKMVRFYRPYPNSAYTRNLT